MALPDITPDDTIIVLMGMTGVGKSSFIDLFTEEKVPIGMDLDSCTEICAIYPASIPGRANRFWLVDTPGFDDNRKTDLEILRELSSWLVESYKENIRLKGIIYLHRIQDVKLGGTGMRNLRMFKELVGKENLGSIVLATTFWDQTNSKQYELREHQLRTTEDFWGKMISHGSRMFRHDTGKASGTDILKYLLDRSEKATYEIQVEMVDKNKALDQTAAGAVVTTTTDELRRKYEAELEKSKREMQQAVRERDIEWQREIQELREERGAWLYKQEEEKEKAKAKADELWGVREAEREAIREQHHEQYLMLNKLYSDLWEQTQTSQTNQQQRLELEITAQRLEIAKLKKEAEKRRCIVM